MHQSYAKRINALRAQHGGEKRAFEAVEALVGSPGGGLRRMCSSHFRAGRIGSGTPATGGFLMMRDSFIFILPFLRMVEVVVIGVGDLRKLEDLNIHKA